MHQKNLPDDIYKLRNIYCSQNSVAYLDYQYHNTTLVYVNNQ